jgi:hypothetical protein
VFDDCNDSRKRMTVVGARGQKQCDARREGGSEDKKIGWLGGGKGRCSKSGPEGANSWMRRR